MKNQIEDGMGCAGLVPTKAEQSAEDAEREAYDRMYSTLMAEIERLRQIAAHVPAAIYIKAKEAAGYGVVVRVNREELCEGSKLAIKGENQYL
jgi:hypothetical protein